MKQVCSGVEAVLVVAGVLAVVITEGAVDGITEGVVDGVAEGAVDGAIVGLYEPSSQRMPTPFPLPPIPICPSGHSIEHTPALRTAQFMQARHSIAFKHKAQSATPDLH